MGVRTSCMNSDFIRNPYKNQSFLQYPDQKYIESVLFGISGVPWGVPWAVPIRMITLASSVRLGRGLVVWAGGFPGEFWGVPGEGGGLDCNP